jgi:hypothetical protein
MFVLCGNRTRYLLRYRWVFGHCANRSTIIIISSLQSTAGRRLLQLLAISLDLRLLAFNSLDLWLSVLRLIWPAHCHFRMLIHGMYVCMETWNMEARRYVVTVYLSCGYNKWTINSTSDYTLNFVQLLFLRVYALISNWNCIPWRDRTKLLNVSP